MADHGFWNQLVGPFFVLAPMSDVTDAPFRAIVAGCGRPDVFYTEFVSAHGLASDGRARLLKDLVIRESDHPIVAQFFGTNPEHMRKAGVLAGELGFDGVDINMGCPDRAIIKQGAGIALCKTPKLAQELIAAVRDGTSVANRKIPVAVKTRLGLHAPEEMEAWIPTLLEAQPDVLVVHGRTAREMSKVPAHWDLIGRVARMCHDADVLCIGNGDVMSRSQGIGLAEHYGVDGLMIGRGIFHNPWMFNREDHIGTPREKLELLLQHTDLWLKQWDGIKSFHLMKKFYKMYVAGWDGSAHLRARLMECNDAESVRDIVSEELAQM